MSWEHYKLNDICKSISDGDHQPPPKAENGIPFVTIANITNANKFDFSNTMFVPQEYYDKLDDKRRAHVGDILYSVVGSFGIPVYMSEEQKFVFQRHIAILRPDETKVVPQFLYYTMLSRDFYMKADAVALGAAQRTVSLTSLRGMAVAVPDLEIQKKIVDVLKPYDELIENNQKQIKLLEEATQRLYKEWFVDLRFPGYEKTEIVDGVPKGWKKHSIGDVFTTVLGGTPSRANANYWNGDIPWINSGEVNSLRIIKESEFITELGLKKSSTKLMPKHTTVLAITGATLGQVSYTEIETCANQSVVGIIDETQTYSAYIYLFVSNNIWSMIGKATGGAQQHINKDIVNEYSIVLPDKEMILKLNSIVEPMFSKMADLYIQNLKLAEARDRLLPKLMSGEVEV
ncbi:MAG: restriction endonuclease subunit S [Eubacteriales bacterium]|nr:restriction endonuclease subunit S [Eubacteriales bacterium]